jgi:putative aldouronate transport system permease protein
MSDAAVRATVNTIVLNLLFIGVMLVVSLLLAFLIFQIYHSKGTKYYQTALLLPNFMSFVIVSYFVFAFFANENGVANTVLNSIGKTSINWYGEPKYWPWILMVAHTWSGMGWASLIYLSAMIGIDTEIFEAATIDGAGRVSQFFSITLPIILPIVVINLLLALGRIFSADFGLFFLLPRDQGALYPTTDVLDTFIYRSLTALGDIGMASAAQFYQSVVGFTLLMLANWAVKRFTAKDRDLGLF